MAKEIHVVAAVMENPEGELLCALRGPSMTLPNVWEFPGGKVKAAEAHAAALEREIEEELGCRIRAGGELHVHTHDYGSAVVTLHCLQADIIEGVPSPSEHSKLLWMPRAQLQSLVWAPADVPAVTMLSGGAARS
ncbi:(deoxy)nucleoside triphosphate pyrophosphohydrolase [Alkalicoccus chagannorensis]|uniref:(deoxy)nucleoside triphosphate pyrophosphohydrolase n=1 Tax=Alkalicoccus chagannorensis TaxID=427072 RepID=UPI000429C70A|nr:(deoxy)nucleoside triphosphate pyrophosphohydrolase [Alkalicoccus chagannorensis]